MLSIDEFLERYQLDESARQDLLTLISTPDRSSLAGQKTVILSRTETIDLTTGGSDKGHEYKNLGKRYEDLAQLGVGGMGEVRRVRDKLLNREVAMKVIKEECSTRSLARFLDEAQTTAQLEHPGIVPVHDLGHTSAGRAYFTMKEIRGRTMGEVIRHLHRSSTSARWGQTRDGWTFRRLVEAFRKVCEAVGYAHSRKVVHRDLKPENIMLGDFGEVLVVDWGLAKVIGQPDRNDEGIVSPSQHMTQHGDIKGTPAYMSPEQARGEIDLIDGRSDVYSLGAILYEILAGHAPFFGRNPLDVVNRVIKGTFQPLGRARRLPPELTRISESAMSHDREQRPIDGSAMATEVADWLEGAKKRDEGLAVVWQANALGPRIRQLKRQAAERRFEGERRLEQVKSWQGEAEKIASWSLLDEAMRLEREAEVEDFRSERLLYGALTHMPDLPEAHGELAIRFRQAHQEAEAAGNEAETLRFGRLLHEHASSLPPGPIRSSHFAYLKGDGSLTVRSEPTGATVGLYQYQEKNRRLAPIFIRSLGQTPIENLPLSMGSYLLVLRARDMAQARYPVLLDRQQQFEGTVKLLAPDDLGPGECYVPAGPFLVGGDPFVPEPTPRTKEWADGFVIRQHPVTNREYIRFLDDLVARGLEEEAMQFVPRERAGKAGELGAMIYGRNKDGSFELVPDADGDLWNPDWPVFLVNWFAASSYAAWYAEKTGQPWRLPTINEWIKAARGADQRFFPWGDHFDASWCCMRDSHKNRPLPATIDEFPVDESPYLVRGMNGNVREWLANAVGPDRKANRGGAWYDCERDCRINRPGNNEPAIRYSIVGFRIVRSVT